MPVQHTFGTAGATGGGFAGFKGLQPLFREERLDTRPDWSWQRRSAKTMKDQNQWYSLWSFGCRVGAGSPIGSDGAGWYDLSMKDLYEPYSCDGAGTQTCNFLRGICKDSVGTPVANAIVQGFVTATDTFVGQVEGNTDGTYLLGVCQAKTTAHYLVAYKAGSPDIAGTTVNTLLPTNVDGT